MANGIGKTRYHLDKSGRFGRGNPLDRKTTGVHGHVLKDHSDSFRTGQCNVITFQVMAFSQVSPHNDYAIRTLGQGIDHQVRMNHARAHDSYRAHVWWILHSGNARQVASGIGAPSA